MIADTSLEANNKVNARQLTGQCLDILEFFRAYPKARFTRRQIASFLGIEHSTASARIHKLIDKKLLVDTKEKQLNQDTGAFGYLVCLPEALKK
jgi:DNA-binding MarR family transcriptional regulator